MRRYYPIWKKLKETGACVIAASPALHPRIKKAVIKEKDQDLAYKYILAEECKRARVVVKSEGSQLSFTLVTTIGLNDI